MPIKIFLLNRFFSKVRSRNSNRFYLPIYIISRFNRERKTCLLNLCVIILRGKRSNYVERIHYPKDCLDNMQTVLAQIATSLIKSKCLTKTYVNLSLTFLAYVEISGDMLNVFQQILQLACCQMLYEFIYRFLLKFLLFFFLRFYLMQKWANISKRLNSTRATASKRVWF